jgi:hypothetical protein
MAEKKQPKKPAVKKAEKPIAEPETEVEAKQPTKTLRDQI